MRGNKCCCGSQWFSTKNLLVTCPDGRSFSFDRSLVEVSCMRCCRRYLWKANDKSRERLDEIDPGEILEVLEKEAEESSGWRNRDGQLYHKVEA